MAPSKGGAGCMYSMHLQEIPNNSVGLKGTQTEIFCPSLIPTIQHRQARFGGIKYTSPLLPRRVLEEKDNEMKEVMKATNVKPNNGKALDVVSSRQKRRKVCQCM